MGSYQPWIYPDEISGNLVRINGRSVILVPDKNKVKKGLECCIESDRECVCPDDCPYDDDDNDVCEALVKVDALKLIEELEERIAIMMEGKTIPDMESVITHLQIIHTWAEFARERDLQFFTPKHLEDIAQWSDDAIELLKDEKEYCNQCAESAIKTTVELQEEIARLRSMLKEQEAVVHPEPSCEMTYITDCCCDLCGVQLIREDNFCRCCGKRIEWEGR